MTQTNDDAVDLAAGGTLLNISGRTFRPCTSTTFEQDIHIMAMVRDAGIMKVGATFDPLTQDLDDIAQQIIMQAFSSGKLFDLLAGTLEEVGVPWSMGEARANAQFFAQLTDAADKAALNGSIVGALLGFFISGAASSLISPKSSRPPMTFNAVGVRTDVLPSSEVPRTTATGTPLSETSPGTTSSEPAP